jgi:glycosyltransferase involved in cell wall biosynthesis
LVLLEAMASGLPVAAYPAIGPSDVIADSGAGVLDEDLDAAVRRALHIDPARCRQRAMQFTWEAATRQFLDNLVSCRPSPSPIPLNCSASDAASP